MDTAEKGAARKLLVAMGLVTAVILMAQCGPTRGKAEPKLAPVQPNRTSELAEAMRQLDAELVVFRDRFLEGDKRWAEASFTEYDLNDLAPTDSSMFVEGYTAFAMAFHKRVSDFNRAPGPETYAGVVSGCESCHQKACPGPLERIAKRQLPE
jgi:hypothetical protein